jgi:hypothetical protein
MSAATELIGVAFCAAVVVALVQVIGAADSKTPGAVVAA